MVSCDGFCYICCQLLILLGSIRKTWFFLAQEWMFENSRQLFSFVWVLGVLFLFFIFFFVFWVFLTLFVLVCLVCFVLLSWPETSPYICCVSVVCDPRDVINFITHLGSDMSLSSCLRPHLEIFDSSSQAVLKKKCKILLIVYFPVR